VFRYVLTSALGDAAVVRIIIIIILYYAICRQHTTTQTAQTQTARVHLKYNNVDTNLKAPSCAH